MSSSKSRFECRLRLAVRLVLRCCPPPFELLLYELSTLFFFSSLLRLRSHMEALPLLPPPTPPPLPLSRCCFSLRDDEDRRPLPPLPPPNDTIPSSSAAATAGTDPFRYWNADVPEGAIFVGCLRTYYCASFDKITADFLILLFVLFRSKNQLINKSKSAGGMHLDFPQTPLREIKSAREGWSNRVDKMNIPNDCLQV